MASTRRLTLAIQMQLAQAVREMEGMRHQMNKLTKHTGDMGKTMFNAQVAFAAFQQVLRGVTQFLGGAIKEFIEAERVEAQLNATLKSTAYAAGLTADELKRMASGLQSVTAWDDEAIMGAESLLLTFTKIGKDVFPQALETVLDMSTALGQDLKSSSIQLGKALQDPILGVTALRRVGVNFNAAQVDVIKNLVNTGKAAEAQALILKELQTEFGGSARAARDTLGGALAALKNQFGDLQESLGAKFAPIIKMLADKLIPILEGPMEMIGDALGDWLAVMIEILPTIFDLAKALMPLFKTIMDLVSALWVSLKPAFDQIVKIIDILVPIIDKLFKAVSPLIGIFGDVFATALEVVADLLESLSPILNLILDILKPLFEILKPIVHLLGEVLKPVLDLLFLPLKMIGETIKILGTIIDDSLHHWENLAKANGEAIDGLTKTREEYQKMEVAIKSGSVKQSELLKTQNELVEKYPELRGAIDLVNGSYENNVAVINQAILARKEEQINLLIQTQEEIRANLRRMDSWRMLREITSVIAPEVSKQWDAAIKGAAEKMIALGGDIKVAKKELEEFQKALANPPKPKAAPKPSGVPAGAGGTGLDIDKMLSEQIELTQRQKELSEQSYADQISYAEAYADSLSGVYDGIENAFGEVTDEIADNWTETIDAMSAEVEKWGGIISGIVGQLSDIFGQYYENQLTSLDNEYGKRKKLIEANVKDEKKRTAMLEALEEEKAEKESSIKRQQWQAQHTASIIESIINTALGITNALKSAAPPLNFILAGIVGTMGAIQTGLIAAQPMPSFAQGGAFRTSGPTAIQVGDNSGGVEEVTVRPISSFGANAGANVVYTGPLILQVDATPIYKGIYRAIKDGIAVIPA